MRNVWLNLVGGKYSVHWIVLSLDTQSRTYNVLDWQRFGMNSGS